jgi:predicted DNA-binding transcriptional regulator YafY
LRLLGLLSARAAWSGTELANRLEVTERTLQRDIARLRELGSPIEAATGLARRHCA